MASKTERPCVLQLVYATHKFLILGDFYKAWIGGCKAPNSERSRARLKKICWGQVKKMKSFDVCVSVS
jgi:hypothetical protein